jgi:hypothetical protein
MSIDIFRCLAGSAVHAVSVAYEMEKESATRKGLRNPILSGWKGGKACGMVGAGARRKTRWELPFLILKVPGA